ncbi:MAG: glycosyltransferase family A protein [Bacteroidia bacterium]
MSEIIILDDSRKMGQVCPAAPGYPGSCKHGSPPAGWLGKNRACHLLAEAAKGDYFLFLDADVARLDERLIPSALAQMEQQQLSLLSIFPDQMMHSFGERIIVPLMHYLLLSLLPLRWIRSMPFPSMAAANGQFMLFKAADYRKHRWHEAVKDVIVEDIAIMQEVKKAGLKGMTFTANGLIHTRMYSGLKEGIAGFGKNILAGFGNSIPGLLFYLLMVLIWPVWLCVEVALGQMSPVFLWIAAGGILFVRIGVSLLANQAVIQNLLLHPVQMAALLRVSVQSIFNKIRKQNTWKGRNVQL